MFERHILVTGFALVSLLGCDVAEPIDPPPSSEADEALSGGDTTVFDVSREAFARPARNLSDEGREIFSEGDHIFGRSWVAAPASAEGSDGLGPLYNATNCTGCHFKDGRGAPPAEGDDFVGLLLRIGVPSADGRSVVPEPTYGGQFNPFGVFGVLGEGTAWVSYEEIPGAYEDGEPYSLRAPTYSFSDLGYGPMADGLLISPRIAPHMVGLGLLEALPEAILFELADPTDVDGDGISGRPNYVTDVTTGERRVGRFGWKANQPSVLQQSAGAYLGDLGITSPLFTEESCTEAEQSCGEAPSGGAPEIDESKLMKVTFYAKTLGVPARRDVDDEEVVRGRDTFREIGCGSCHAYALTTGDDPEHPELSGQVIWPYTDLLLHDMGEGLADGKPDHEATGNEWRTPPLWGIGLIVSVNKHEFLLHDGRARGFAEAILWHGGEAEAGREAFRALPKSDREALLAFLASL